MRLLIMLLALTVVGGLLMSSQAWTADQYQYKYTDKNMESALTGEQVHQRPQVQEQGYFRTLVQSQDHEYFGVAPSFGSDDEDMTPVFGNDDECIGPVYCDEDD